MWQVSEILECIIHNIGTLPTNNYFKSRERDEYLKALSLTCKDFVTTSRHYLFKSVELSSQFRCQRLYSTLKHSPEISYHIRNLHILDDSDKLSSTPDIFAASNQNVLSELISLLKHLSYFELRFHDCRFFNWDKDRSWNDIPPFFQDLLFKLLFSCSIPAICIENVDDLPKSFAMLLTGIPRVYLTDVTFNTESANTDRVVEENKRSESMSTRKLQFLTIQNPTQEIQPFIDALSHPDCGIEKVTYISSNFKIPPFTNSTIRKIVKCNAGSLNKLIWNCAKLSLDRELIDLGDLTNLQSIVIRADLWRGLKDDDSTIRILNTVSPQNKIAKVTLRWKSLSVEDHELEQLDPEVETLDVLLSGLMFPNLQNVHFELLFPKVNREYHALEAIEKGLRTMFPLMHARGLISRESIAYISPRYVESVYNPDGTYQRRGLELHSDERYRWSDTL